MKEIYALIGRVLPEHRDRIVCRLCEPCEGNDVYEIGWEDGKLILTGNNTISLATALGRYLKYDAKVNISWCGGNLALPEKLPQAKPRRQVILQKYRVYMNYCTFNYTASWWDFDRWEKELDFMALQGINMPLAVVGVEACWYHALVEFGFTDLEAREFLAGPAFLAWQWMGNLEGFGGPLPMGWIEKRTVLGRKILERMLELGMQPIQQGFAGVVPRKLKEKYPENGMKYQKSWNGFAQTVQLDPTDPLFTQLGLVFLKKQKELFGAYGYYAADPFHEGKPPVDGDEYLRAVGRSISGLFAQFDPNYRWVMQAWSIRKEIACSVPKDRLLVLDLSGTRYASAENFWGYEFVAGNLHNFGGRTKLHGDMRRLSENYYHILREKGVNIAGAGMFMEGIEHNPVYYDLAFEMLTEPEPVELDGWIREYAERRYGKTDENIRQAWEILLRTVYAPGTNGVELGSAICTRPAVNLKKTGPGPGFLFPYGIERLRRALELLRKAECDTEGYRYDLVDLLRQYVSDYAYDLYTQVARSFLNRDKAAFADLSQKYLELLDDMDRLLSLRPEFCFGRWVRAAEAWGDTAEEKALYAYNAASLLTVWGLEEDSILFDYAWREWSGLISSYYKPRWVMFFDMLKDLLETDGEWYEEDLRQTVDQRACWRANAFYSQMADWEAAWLYTKKEFPVYENVTLEDEVRRLLEKYPLQ